MFSLDNFPDWSVFHEREEVSLETDLISPAAEVAALLRTRRSTLLELQREMEDERAAWLDKLVRQAVLVAQLATVLERSDPEHSVRVGQEPQAPLKRFYRSVRLVKNQMLDALRAAGLEIEIPLGKAFDEVADFVSVEGWRHRKDISSEVVLEVVEPIVYYRGEAIHQGRVVMGGPLAEETLIAEEMQQSNEERKESSHAEVSHE